ncbi:hypothetical protein LJC10_01805 [Selenomonadales bacterium OttesenSCG-928-I06]|nr:hypothetical protein [Selenomonadales bacterium OttesenSCG-928-I06]
MLENLANMSISEIIANIKMLSSSEQMLFLIAIFALLISLYNLNKNRTSLDAYFDKEITVVPRKKIYFNEYPNDIICEQGCLGVSVYVINPSSNDIGYFDLMAFNSATNIRHLLMIKKDLPYDLRDVTVRVKKPDNQFYTLEIPKKTYGVFRSNTITVLDLLITPVEPYGDDITISFRVAIKDYIRSYKDIIIVVKKMLGIYKDLGPDINQYNLYKKTYVISGWQKLLVADVPQIDSEVLNQIAKSHEVSVEVASDIIAQAAMQQGDSISQEVPSMAINQVPDSQTTASEAPSFADKESHVDMLIKDRSPEVVQINIKPIDPPSKKKR